MHQAITQELVGSDVLYTDSTHMKANANKKKFEIHTVDGKHNIITDTHVTPGNVHDSKPYLSRLDRQLTAFNLYPEYVGLDAGYRTAGICKGLEERGIEGVIGYRRPNKKAGYFAKRQFF